MNQAAARFVVEELQRYIDNGCPDPGCADPACQMFVDEQPGKVSVLPECERN